VTPSTTMREQTRPEAGPKLRSYINVMDYGDFAQVGLGIHRQAGHQLKSSCIRWLDVGRDFGVQLALPIQTEAATHCWAPLGRGGAPS
jgi:hypothetical protein